MPPGRYVLVRDLLHHHAFLIVLPDLALHQIDRQRDMLHCAHGQFKPFHVPQSSAQTWLGRPSPHARSACIVQQAEPNDVQILDKPILRRPEPPKSEPSSEEIERKRAATRAALEKVERASRNGKAQGAQGKIFLANVLGLNTA